MLCVRPGYLKNQYPDLIELLLIGINVHSENWMLLQQSFKYQGPLKFVISSYPDLRAKVLLSAIYLNIWHHLNFYDIHLKSNIFSKL